LHQAIQGTPDKKPRPEDRQAALKLVARQQEIISEVSKILAILDKEGAAMAFPEVFQQLRDDMKRVQQRLEKCDVNTATRLIEEDILDTLQEMIKALKNR